MEKRKYTVYQTTNLLNNMIYIGCHVLKLGKNKDSYLGSGTNIVKVVNEIGKESFKNEILFVYDNKKEMLAKERELVNDEFIARQDTYNIVLGGGTFVTNNCVSVRDQYGNTMMVHKTDPRFLSKELVGVAKGHVAVKDKNDFVYYLNKNDPRIISGEFVHVTKGRITVKDKNEKTLSVFKNDPRYLSGELISITINKIVVKDKQGNVFQVNKNDHRVISGEFVHISKGYVSVKDKEGNNMRILKDDPRFLSGELVGINKNKIVSIETRLKQSKSHKGRKISEETRSKMQKAQKGRFHPKHSDESKKLLSLSLKGRKCIHKGTINKKIKITEIESYLALDWILGKSPGSK